MQCIQRRICILILAVLTALATIVAMIPAASATPPKNPQRVEPVTWTPCNDGFECAEYRVPLDYDHPGGRQISLALVKLPATDPARRIGSLFFNPGGPGGSGVDWVQELGPGLFTPEVRARFDIVGFDPRGIRRSDPLRCFDTLEEADDASFPRFPYPNSPEERRTWIAANRALIAACERRGGPILDHMSTADVARDLDRLRQAVGDQKLTYYGISYGSVIGNMYANLFPGRFRALVIDGVLDPVAWTTGRGSEGRRVPMSTRIGGAAGGQETLEEFFRLCDAGGSNCAFAPNSAQRYAELYRTLQRTPLLLPQEDGSTITYDESFLVADTYGALNVTEFWPDLAALLVELEATAKPARIQAVRQGLGLGLESVYLNLNEGPPGVVCTDSINPTSYAAWDRDARQSLKRYGIFGPLRSWLASTCVDWPGRAEDRYLGPFTTRTAKPVLVVGNLFDPGTPYRGAVAVSRQLPNSRLLTLHAWGHTSLFTSSCADEAIARYLLTSVPPARGTVCQSDVVPFAQPALSAERTRATAGPATKQPIWPTRPHW